MKETNLDHDVRTNQITHTIEHYTTIGQQTQLGNQNWHLQNANMQLNTINFILIFPVVSNWVYLVGNRAHKNEVQFSFFLFVNLNEQHQQNELKKAKVKSPCSRVPIEPSSLETNNKKKIRKRKSSKLCVYVTSISFRITRINFF